MMMDLPSFVYVPRLFVFKHITPPWGVTDVLLLLVIKCVFACLQTNVSLI